MLRQLKRKEAFMDACAAKVSHPTLLIYADHDCFFPLESGRRLAAKLPNARFEVIPDCGHFLQEDKPAEYSALVDAFLSAEAHEVPEETP